MTPLPLPERPAAPLKVSRRGFLQAGLAGAVAAGVQQAAAPSLLAAPPATGMFADPEYHFLNRISWSVRSVDLARVKRIGILKYLEEQLSPRYVALGELVRVPTALRLARKTIYRYKDPYDVASKALVSGMILRARTSAAQLYERVVEFWSDHFNIAAEDLEPEVVDWQRTVIRRYAFTKFRTLLQATAKHVAMLYYLDNALSEKEHPNENYARELMELHTLGVGSGYSEMDVKEIARVFTGWTADYTDYGGFIFDPDLHDTGNKTVLNTPITGATGPAGMQEGVQVLNLLADDPRTHRFVLKKLCTRFISDAFANPLPGSAQAAFLDNTLMPVWQSTDGDIKAILRAIFLSDMFNQAPLQKLRRPLDFFVAALRATTTVFRNYDDLEYQTELLDQVPYGWGPPNGFPDAAAAWANTSGLLARWAVAQTVTNDALPGNGSSMLTLFQVPLRRQKTVGALVDAMAQQFYAIQLSDETRAALIAFATDGAGSALTPVTPDLLTDKLGPLAGLVLSLPEFQWR
ncbi:MAG TPA: DUF1800 domain-containing protein [Chthoniobacteraceae bacterium]|nr:DUF1800 domain-containing protein [Chthoniobacteraceae bacterium]